MPLVLEIVLRGVFEMLHVVFILVHLKEYSVSVLLTIRPLIASQCNTECHVGRVVPSSIILCRTHPVKWKPNKARKPISAFA